MENFLELFCAIINLRRMKIISELITDTTTKT